MNDLLSKINDLKKTSSWNDEDVFSFIYQDVLELLSRDIQLLFQLLYRIDVKETLVKEVFQHSDVSDDIAHRLTELIVVRLKQKADMRRRYSSQ